MKIKSAADMKYYLYRSDAKLKMLFGQIARNDDKKTIEWKMSVRSVSRSTKLEKDGIADEDDMLKAVVEHLEYAKQVGTIYEPNLYVKGVMPMRWGLYNDAGERDPDLGPLVYFGGLDKEERILLGLGGSSKHVLGHEGATSTYSRSSTPALVTALCRGIESGTKELRYSDSSAEDEVYEAFE